MDINQLDFELPVDRIAETPMSRRDESRLLVLHMNSDSIEHRLVRDLPDLLNPTDLMVINETRVLPARFDAIRASTGGKVEGLFLETRNDATWHVLLKSGGKLRTGECLQLDGQSHQLELREKQDDGSWLATKLSDRDTQSLLQSIGSMPLPPYILKRRTELQMDDLDAMDHDRYQTIYARTPGAVAAPTAGLHFTDDLMTRLEATQVEFARVTLHVGMGTFQPVRVQDLDDHPMHTEWFRVPTETFTALDAARNAGRRIIPVGTTSVRTLESLPHPMPETYNQGYEADTNLLIQPGFRFRWTDGLMTNFHLPKSTLLALVGAFVGLDRLMNLYQLAIREGYRFYSYGDAMLALPD